MVYKTKIIDRNIKTVPFERAFEIYTAAYTQSLESQEYKNLERHKAKVAALEQDYSDDSEAPTEVSFSDEVPLQPVSDRDAVEAGQKAIIEEFLEGGIIAPNMLPHYMPQIVKLLGERWDSRCINPNTNQVNGIVARKFLFKDFVSDWDKGLWLVLMLNSRASWLTAQHRGDAKQFCSLVPLIPYAIKLIHSVPYSKWEKETISKVVNTKLAAAMLADVSAADSLTKDQLLEIRNKGLLYKSGPREGTARPAESSFKLYDVKGTALEGMPELAQVMLTQIWCAHPSNRTRYMILDPKNWENIPDPLVEARVFNTEKATGPKLDLPWSAETSDFPWDITAPVEKTPRAKPVKVSPDLPWNS